MAPVAVRLKSKISPEDRYFRIPESGNWWMAGASPPGSRHDTPAVQCVISEPVESTWYWGNPIYCVTPVRPDAALDQMCLALANALGIQRATEELLFGTSTPFAEDLGESRPFFRSGTKRRRPSVTYVGVEENPIVRVAAPVKARHLATVVARRKALFKTGPRFNLHRLD